MIPLYICDIDGTLSDPTHRRHYVDGSQEKDWDKFYSLCHMDKPILEVCELVERLWLNADVWFFTGRRESERNATQDWLEQNVGLPPGIFPECLIMRPDGDTRPDDILKQEMLDNMLIEDRKRIAMVFDDRQRVVDMWRRNGIVCAQVAPGQF